VEEEESISQLDWSLLFCFFGRGESPGVRERFSPREGILLSVSAVEAAELDIRRKRGSIGIIDGEEEGEISDLEARTN